MKLRAYKPSSCTIMFDVPRKRDAQHTRFMKLMRRLKSDEKRNRVKILEVDYDELTSAKVTWINLLSTPREVHHE